MVGWSEVGCNTKGNRTHEFLYFNFNKKYGE